jgi:hypothetical protein
MNELMSHVMGWIGAAGDHPVIAAGVVLAVVAFFLVSNWKPKSTRDAESRLREIRDESHDYYRHLRPPGR